MIRIQNFIQPEIWIISILPINEIHSKVEVSWALSLDCHCIVIGIIVQRMTCIAVYKQQEAIQELLRMSKVKKGKAIRTLLNKLTSISSVEIVGFLY